MPCSQRSSWPAVVRLTRWFCPHFPKDHPQQLRRRSLRARKGPADRPLGYCHSAAASAHVRRWSDGRRCRKLQQHVWQWRTWTSMQIFRGHTEAATLLVIGGSSSCTLQEQTVPLECSVCKTLLAKLAPTAPPAAVRDGAAEEAPVLQAAPTNPSAAVQETDACEAVVPQAVVPQTAEPQQSQLPRKRGRPKKNTPVFDVLRHVENLQYSVLAKDPITLQCRICGWVFGCHKNSDYYIERHEQSQAHKGAVQRAPASGAPASVAPAQESAAPACAGVYADDPGYMLNTVREALELWFDAGCPASVQHPYEGSVLTYPQDGRLNLRTATCTAQGHRCVLGTSACRDCAQAANRAKYIKFVAVWGMRLDSISLLHQWILGEDRRDEFMTELVQRDYWNILSNWSAFAERVRMGTFQQFLNSLREQLCCSPVKTRNSSLRMLLEARSVSAVSEGTYQNQGFVLGC